MRLFHTKIHLFIEKTEKRKHTHISLYAALTRALSSQNEFNEVVNSNEMSMNKIKQNAARIHQRKHTHTRTHNAISCASRVHNKRFQFDKFLFFRSFFCSFCELSCVFFEFCVLCRLLLESECIESARTTTSVFIILCSLARLHLRQKCERDREKRQKRQQQQQPTTNNK